MAFGLHAVNRFMGFISTIPGAIFSFKNWWYLEDIAICKNFENSVKMTSSPETFRQIAHLGKGSFSSAIF